MSYRITLIFAGTFLTFMDQEMEKIQDALGLIHGAISDILGLQKGKKSDLSPIAISILYVSSRDRLRVNDISRSYGIKKSTSSGYVDNLEKKGYARRIKSDTDRRVTYIVPTAKGKKWIASREKKLREYIMEHMKNLSSEEQDQFVGLLAKFVK